MTLFWERGKQAVNQVWNWILNSWPRERAFKYSVVLPLSSNIFTKIKTCKSEFIWIQYRHFTVNSILLEIHTYIHTYTHTDKTHTHTFSRTVSAEGLGECGGVGDVVGWVLFRHQGNHRAICHLKHDFKHQLTRRPAAGLQSNHANWIYFAES